MQLQIYVLIPEDDAYKPVQAIAVGTNLYKILPTSDYDPANAEWEFAPGTVVRCEERSYRGKDYLLAVEKIG
jgi:hypothetical protein